MRRNAVKIICNPYMDKISYFFKNEMGEWLLLSGSSPLLRQYYSQTTIKLKGKEIVEKLDEIYNRKNKGLDIFFEGTKENYEYLSEAVKKYLPERDVVCKIESTKIAVVGKKASGKTTLIKEIAKTKGINFDIFEKDNYIQYVDKQNNIEWIEIKGIDLGNANVLEASLTIEGLVNAKLSKVIYCVSGDTGKLEKIEKEMIMHLKSTFLSVDVITAITMCYKDEVQDIIDEIEKTIDHMQVFPILAKEYRVNARTSISAPYVVEPFGINELITYVFEGKKLSQQFSKELIEARKIEKSSEYIQKNNKSKQVQEVKTKREIKKKNKKNKATHVVLEKPKAPYYEKNKFQKIAIVGKKSVGKTTLINGCAKYINHDLKETKKHEYIMYEDAVAHIQWFEIKGIDLGIEEIKEAFSTISSLILEGITHLLYCISGEAGKVEEVELQLLRQVKQAFPSINILIVITKGYKYERFEMVDKLRQIIGEDNIIVTLAQEYKTRIKDAKTGEAVIIEPFGLEEIYAEVKGNE